MEKGFLQHTKSVLRSLIISSPNGMTIDKLNRDHKKYEGEWIPYQKLGYQSLEQFLKSLSDTLVVSGNGKDALVYFIANEKVKHINDMMTAQKNTTRDRKVAELPKSSQKKPNIGFSNTTNTTQKIYPVPSNFNNQYGFQQGGCFYYPVIPQTFPMNPNYILQTPIYGNSTVNFQTPNFLPAYNIPLKNTSKPVISKNQYNHKRASIHDNTTKAEQIQLKNEPNNPKCVPISISESMNSKSEINNNSNKTQIIDKTYPSINIRNQSNLSDTKYDVNKQFLSNDEKPKKLEDIPETAQNNKNILDSQNNSTDKLAKNGHSKNIVEKVNISTNLLKQLHFPGKKKTPAIRPLNCQKRGNPIVDSSEFVLEQSENSLKSDSNVKANSNPFSHVDSSDNDMEEAIPQFAANNLVFQVDIPENMVPFGRKIASYELPKEMKKGSVIGIFISEIHSPFKFWFHVYKEIHELDVLMHRIELFYRNLHDTDLVIQTPCIAPGQVCAALYGNMWHRAEVLTNVCNQKAKVHFVDYGTVSEIETRYIKYLPIIFANTPSQAIRGCLSHIKPLSSVWTRSSIKEFLSMVKDVVLYAQIMEIDEEEKTIYMVLCENNNSKTVQINKELVDRGFAKLDKEWDKNKITKNCYRKRHPKEIFPTFKMLETGEYPSFFELEELLARGIDYEKLNEEINFSHIIDSVACNGEFVSPSDLSKQSNTMSFKLLDTNPFKSDIISEVMSLKIFGD